MFVKTFKYSSKLKKPFKKRRVIADNIIRFFTVGLIPTYLTYRVVETIYTYS